MRIVTLAAAFLTLGFSFGMGAEKVQLPKPPTIALAKDGFVLDARPSAGRFGRRRSRRG